MNEKKGKAMRSGSVSLRRFSNLARWFQGLKSPSWDIRIMTGLRLLLFIVWILGVIWLILRWTQFSPDRIYNYDFTLEKSSQRYLEEQQGWVKTKEGLRLSPGSVGRIRLAIPMGPDERIRLRLWCTSKPPQLVNQLIINQGGQKRYATNVSLNGEIMEPQSIPDFYGSCIIQFITRLQNEELPAHIIPLQRIQVEFTSGLKFSVAGFLIFVFFTFSFYLLVALYVIPECLEPLITNAFKRSWIDRLFTLLFIAAVVCVAWQYFLQDNRWTGYKTFDDKMAISNASTLLDKKFNVEALYFRSMHRPIFVAFSLPIVTAFPNSLGLVQTSPSDFREKVWFIYMRPHKDQGDAFLPVSLAVLGLGIAMCILFYQIMIMLGTGRVQALVAMLFFGFFFKNVLVVHVTQTFNLFVNIMAVVVYLRIHKSESISGWIAAGVALALAALAKNTAQTTAVAIAMHQALFIIRRRKWKEDLPRLISYWLAVIIPVLLWYYGYLNGLFYELKKLHDAFIKTQELMHYELTSWRLIKRCFRHLLRQYWYFPVAGIFFSMLWKRSREAGLLFIVWALAVTPMFLLPFIFPRFFKYFIPASAYFSSQFLFGMAALIIILIRILIPTRIGEKLDAHFPQLRSSNEKQREN